MENEFKPANIYGKIGGADGFFVPVISPLLRFAGDVFRPKEEKEAVQKLRETEAQRKILGPAAAGLDPSITGYGNMLTSPQYQSIMGYNQQQMDLNRRNMLKTILDLEPVTDRSKQRDMLRNAAMAQLRNQLRTQQGLTLQGQVGAQAMAQRGLAGATQALTANYQYQ